MTPCRLWLVTAMRSMCLSQAGFSMPKTLAVLRHSMFLAYAYPNFL